MLKIITAALFATSISAGAAEYSPLFGSADIEAFRVLPDQAEAGRQATVPDRYLRIDCDDANCPEPHRFANDGGDSAAP